MPTNRQIILNKPIASLSNLTLTFKSNHCVLIMYYNTHRLPLFIDPCVPFQRLSYRDDSTSIYTHIYIASLQLERYYTNNHVIIINNEHKHEKPALTSTLNCTLNLVLV